MFATSWLLISGQTILTTKDCRKPESKRPCWGDYGHHHNLDNHKHHWPPWWPRSWWKIFSNAVVLKVSGGEEGKVGTASATPRLPGVSPVVPRIQGGQPPPMQVWDSHEYLCPLCNPYVQPINFRCSGDPSSAPQPLSGCHQTRSPWTGTWNGNEVDLERWTGLRTTTPASDLPVSPPYTAPPPPYLPHCSGSRTIWSNHSKSSLSQSVADKRSEPGELPSLELQRGRGQVEQGSTHLPGHVTSPGSAQQVQQYFFILELESTCPSHFFNLLIRNLLAQDINWTAAIILIFSSPAQILPSFKSDS